MMYRKNMLHQDEQVFSRVLYNSCSDYDDRGYGNAVITNSITPSVNINEIDYEQIRFVDVKLFGGCFRNHDFVNILKKCLTSNFDRSNTSIEWDIYREYRTIHVNNGDFDHLFESDEYYEFKEFLNNEKDLLIDRIILEVHSVYPPHHRDPFIPHHLQIKIPKSFMVDTFPEFPVIQFVVNDENKVDKEVIKKTFINHQYGRPSIKNYIIDHEKGL